jgi:hypothetical protein
MENISLYIPLVLPHVTRETITQVFYNQEIGQVKQVDLIPKLNKRGEYYHCAFVHFHYWFDNIIARNLQERIRDPHLVARVMYDDPYFWIVQENKSEKRAPGKPKLRIDLSDLKPRELEPEFEQVADLDEDDEPKITTAIVNVEYLHYLEQEVKELREENIRLRVEQF